MDSLTLTRLIGPIPQHYTGATEDGPYAHPGGPCPLWGGYRPLPVDVPTSWLGADVRAMLDRVDGLPYRAHTTSTLLVRDGRQQWYVAAPSRPCRRAVTIAVEALRDGATVPGGLLPEETTEALRIHREGGATHWARLPWETEPTYPAAEPVDGDVEVFRRTPDEE